MNAHITFTSKSTGQKVELRKPSSCIIDSSWKLLTDRATIVLARNVRDFESTKVADVFRRGDKVSISLGYDGGFTEEFNGYISNVSADVPITVKCEDGMWILKQTPVNLSLPKVSLVELLKQIVPASFSVESVDFNLGAVRFSNMTVATVLDELKKEYGIYSYVIGDKLFCGKIYDRNDSLETLTINIDKQALPNHNLEFKSADDIFIKIKAVSTLTDGSKIEAEYGDEGGEIQQLTYFNIEDKNELKQLAKADYYRLKVDKLIGTFTMFGAPSLIHGSKIELQSERHEQINGIYFIEALKKDFNDSPKYHQRITIGGKAA